MGTIVVTAPTGNIGSQILRVLPGLTDQKIVAIARNPGKIPAEIRERVTVVEGDLFDAESVKRATSGASALFWLTPPTFSADDWATYYAESAASAVAAIQANGIENVVHLSSFGADRPSGFGPVSFLHGVEAALNDSGAKRILHLRPGYFYENLLAQVGAIQTANSLFFPFPASTSTPMIATRDIGDAAARELATIQARPEGVSVRGLHGPDPTPSFGDAVAQIGAALGRPLQFVEITPEQFHGQVLSMGAPKTVADAYAELMEAIARGEQPAEPRTTETTTPTTLAEWTHDVLAPLVNA